ncbi:MAG: hypothetical protein ACXV8W_14930 [Methylobacter sp.]
MPSVEIIQSASDWVNALSALGSSLVTFIGIIGALLAAITHAVALLPKDKFGFAYDVLKLLAGNYGHAANAGEEKE